MAYKLLGKAVWHGGKWYVRRHFPNAPRNLAIGAGAGLLVAAALIFATQHRSNGE